MFSESSALLASLCASEVGAIVLFDGGTLTRRFFAGVPQFSLDQSSPIVEEILRSGELVWVADISEDPRFADSEFFNQFDSARFFAGGSLESETGELLGIFIVVDSVRKELSESHIAAIAELRRVIVAEIELLAKAAKSDELRQKFHLNPIVGELPLVKSIPFRQDGALLRSVVETVIDGILTIDSWGTIITANSAVTKLFGYAPDEIIGQNVKILMPEPYHGEHDSYLHNYHESGVRKIIGIGREVSGLRKDGSVFSMELAVGETTTPSGQIFTGIVRDITERKKAEEELRRERGLLSAVVETAVDGIITIDEEGIILSANSATVSIFGYLAEELIGENVRILMPDPYHGEHDQYLKNYMGGGEAKIIGIGRQVKGRRKSGEMFPLELAVSETHTEDGRIFTGIVRDITDRVLSEESLMENQRMIQMASKMSRMGAWSVDTSSMEVTWSEEVLRIYGLDSANEYSVEELFEWYPMPGRELVKGSFSRCIETGESFDVEVPFLAQGRELWVRVMGEGSFDSEGRIVRVQGAFQDITEQRNAANSLAASEERFRTLANSMPMIVWTAMGDGEIDYSNQYFSDYTGIPQSEPAGSRWQQTLHPDDIERCFAEWARCLQLGVHYEIEYRLRNGRTGQFRWFLVQARPVKDASGTVVKWYGTGTDIHDTKDLQEQASKLANSLRTTVESITDGFLTMDPEWRFTYINDAAEYLLMKSREELLGRVAWEVFPEAIDSSFYVNYHNAVAEGVSVSFEEYFGPIDRWLDLHAYPSSEGLAVHFRDISDRKHTLQKLEEQTSLLNDAQRIGQMGSYTLDLQAGILRWSQPFGELIGRGVMKSEATLDEFYQYVVPEDRDRVQAVTLKVYQEHEALENQFRIRKPSGEVIWVATRGTTEFDGNGKAVRRLGMMRDITEQQAAAEALLQMNNELEKMVEVRTAELAKTNQELLVAKEYAEAANLFKSTFLSRMSHELRTPMNAILGFGQLLELTDLDEESQDSLSHILKAGRHLLNLINDVLEISRVEIGEIGLSLEPVEVLELLRECESLMRTISKDNDITLITKAESSIYVRADRQKLRQVFINVLSNGIKYNKPGGTVTISVEYGEDKMVSIAFEDTGIGISEANMKRLFLPFERLGVGSVEGTGLGLSLSRSLVEAMGGSMTATSEEGVGSVFKVELIDAVIEHTEMSDQIPHTAPFVAWNSASAKILIIEDNLTNVALLERLFATRPDVELVVAMQGSLGIQLAKKHEPDIILLDLHLPDMSGDEVIALMKLDDELKHIPVIIMSADAFTHRAQALLELGAVQYITKPFDLVDLLHKIDEALKVNRGDHDQ